MTSRSTAHEPNYLHALTNSLSDGTLDKKSKSSLLAIAFGFLSFLVNLLMPENDNL